MIALLRATITNTPIIQWNATITKRKTINLLQAPIAKKKKKKKTIALLHATIAKNKTNAMLHATIAKIRWLLCYMQQSQKIKMNALLHETIAKQMHWSQRLCHQKTIALRYATIANASIVQRNATIIKRWLFFQTHQSSNKMQRSLKDDYFANASIVQQKETIMPLKDDCLASAHRSHQPTRWLSKTTITQKIDMYYLVAYSNYKWNKYVDHCAV